MNERMNERMTNTTDMTMHIHLGKHVVYLFCVKKHHIFFHRNRKNIIQYQTSSAVLKFVCAQLRTNFTRGNKGRPKSSGKSSAASSLGCVSVCTLSNPVAPSAVEEQRHDTICLPSTSITYHCLRQKQQVD